MSHWKDCPECRLKAGECAYCGNSGSVPLCPPMAEPVVLCLVKDVAWPMIVDTAKLDTDAGGRAHVFVSGYVFVSGRVVPLKNIPGPADAPGHWNWRGDPS